MPKTVRPKPPAPSPPTPKPTSPGGPIALDNGKAWRCLTDKQMNTGPRCTTCGAPK